MSKKEKLITRLKSVPRDFTFDELKIALESLGFVLSNAGKTSGSIVEFSKGQTSVVLHKPHQRKELLNYQIKKVLQALEKERI